MFKLGQLLVLYALMMNRHPLECVNVLEIISDIWAHNKREHTDVITLFSSQNSRPGLSSVCWV